MRTGTQLCAPEGFEALCKGVRYHLLRSDPARQRVLLVEFQRKRQRGGEGQRSADIGSKGGASGGHPGVADQVAGGTYASYRPVLHFLSRHRFEQALERGLIFACETQDELPPWLSGVTIVELQAYAELRVGQKRSHAARIDQTLVNLWPLVQNLDQILGAESPDTLINAHARACKPPQHETRFRTAFYAYVCFGCSRWALHYPVHHIGHWDRMGRERKFGRPSRLKGAHHGHGSNDQEMIDRILEGYRKYAGPGQHLRAIYRRTLRTVFGCVVQTDPQGRKSFVHPAGRAFPTFGQFAYRVGQAFPLEVRQVYKYGHTRVRTRLQHSLGRFAESVGNLMERTEQDAYCCDQVAKGYLPGSHQPTLWVVRTRCIASGMIVGIGFSIGGEAASAYRLAKFCEAIDKVKFCSLFGLQIREGDWPSVGVSPHVIHDRGPGATAKAESTEPALRPVIKESAPSYAGQSKASIETTHPKAVKLEGKPHYVETRLSIAQLAAQEIIRTIADNHSIDVTDRLNNDAVEAGVFPTPVAFWNYLDRRGRNHAVSMRFEEAVRAYLTPIELTVQDDAVYFKEMRFDSAALQRSGALQKAHTCGTYRLGGYMLDICVRHLWVEVGADLIEVDAMLAIRDGEEQLYISVVELEQLERLRRDGKLELQSHRLAARAEYEAAFEQHAGQPFDQGVVKGGRNKRSKAASVEERRQIMQYLRAEGGKR